MNYGIHAKKLSSIFQFARTMPLLFVPVSHNKVADTKSERERNPLAVDEDVRIHPKVTMKLQRYIAIY